MLKQLFIFLFAFIATSAMAQSVIPMYADQFIYKSRSGKTNIIFNLPSDNVKGFMYNTGSGAVEFRSGCIKLTDTTYLIGNDTLKIPRQSSANASGTAGGDLYGTYPNPSVDWSHGLSSYDQYYLRSADAAGTYASKTSLNAYLLSSTAAGTYATQASLGSYLLSTDAAGTYASKTSLNAYLLSSTAAGTYATQASLGSYLLTSSAVSTYATITSLNNYLLSSTAASTYAAKVGANDIEVTDPTKGIILRTSDGTRARITLIKYNGQLTLQVSDPL